MRIARCARVQVDLVAGRGRQRAFGGIHDRVPLPGGPVVECNHLHCVAEVPVAVLWRVLVRFEGCAREGSAPLICWITESVLVIVVAMVGVRRLGCRRKRGNVRGLGL